MSAAILMKGEKGMGWNTKKSSKRVPKWCYLHTNELN